MNVLIYADQQSRFLAPRLKRLLTQFSVQSINHKAITSQPWTSNCALLFLPHFASPIPANTFRTITSYLVSGGTVVAFSSSVTSHRKVELGREEPGFVDNAANVYTLGYGVNQENRQTSQLKTGDGCIIEAATPFQVGPIVGLQGDSVESLASYDDGSRIAGFRTRIGSGSLVLWTMDLDSPQDFQIDQVLRKSLLHLGFEVSKDLVEIAKHALPQFLIFNSPQRELESHIPSNHENPKLFQDEHDSFSFYPSSHASSLLSDARTSEGIAGHQHIAVYKDGQRPDPSLTPLFHVPLYFDLLEEMRQTLGLSPVASDAIGSSILYGEVVTSTQTMLDSNPRLLSLLPSPLVSLASHQLSGRGRGSNVWVSPAGCLQFSVLLHVPLATFPSSKLVFIQYLFALAVVEACRQESILGTHGQVLRLKWPNDIYAITEDGQQRKVGGVLVTTSFLGQTASVIIGCGLNVLNDPPILSLSQLVPSFAPSLGMERVAAAIFAKFETMWKDFVSASGSFQPFLSLYLDRWLHSDQLVTITTTEPPTPVRVYGITLDHGLLRTIPERNGWSTGSGEQFIDLQPDGNSFDLMAGLIKSKK